MKHLLTFCLCQALLFSGLYAQDPAPSAYVAPTTGWEVFESLEGKFAVLTPAPMRQRVDTAQTAIGRLAFHSFICREGADMIYLLSYCDYPEQTVHADSSALLSEFFVATMDQSVQNAGGELVYSEDFLWLGYPGKQWRINVPEQKRVIRTKVLVVDNRVYSLQTVMSKGQSLNPNSQRFLESFRLL